MSGIVCLQVGPSAAEPDELEWESYASDIEALDEEIQRLHGQMDGTLC